MTRKQDTEIDAIVDEIVEDRETAQALKARLHSPPTQPSIEAAARGATPISVQSDDDDGDLWNNLPV